MKRTGLLILAAAAAFYAFRPAGTPVYLDDSHPIEERVEDALARMTLEEKVAIIHAQSKFSTPGCPRLGIPELWMSDGPHGVRQEIAWDSWGKAGWTNDSCVAFPALTCLAATFDPQLAYEYGVALGEEARYRKKEVILGPGVNIFRTPLNGRNFEYLGEDPYLAGAMAAPYIKGVQSVGVAACIKHFALNNQEHNRQWVNVEASDRAMREIYLPAFEAGIRQGGAWTLMGAFNKFRGQHTTHHKLLLCDILKGEWGFDGAVISDWGSTHDTRESVLNGLDIEMGTHTDGLTKNRANAYNVYYMATPYLEALKRGEYPVSTLDDKVRRVLRLTFRTAMDRNRPWGSLCTPEHYATSLRIAEAGVVLLKNDDNTLPVAPGKYRKIAVIGENATRMMTQRGGSSELKVEHEISPLAGLQALYGDETVTYAKGYTSGKENGDSLADAAVALARQADMVLFFGGLNKEPHQDTEMYDRESFDLPYGQSGLIDRIVDANPNTAVILISGNAVAMPWADRVPAIVQSWYLGSEAGTATAAILSGKVNPSGKLPFSIPRRIEDNGAMSFGEKSYPGIDMQQTYMEDILVGYRWHDTKRIPARFAFGHGLSYTRFEYGKVSIDRKSYAPGDTIRVKLTVTNTGGRDGAESVQIYASQQSPSLMRPTKELKAFGKIFLKAGESGTLEIDVPVASLAFWDDRTDDWNVEEDRFTLHAAAASDDIRSSVSFKVKK